MWGAGIWGFFGPVTCLGGVSRGFFCHFMWEVVCGEGECYRGWALLPGVLPMITHPTRHLLYDRDGSVCAEEHSVHGQMHRKGGPAYITTHPDGSLRHVAYYRHGKLHREDGPASVWYREGGLVEREGYYLRGEAHRVDGPALIGYRRDGSVWSADYVHGVRQ